LIKTLQSNQIMMLENLRFAKGETENDEGLARIFASYIDVYVNDAFGACHRAHASVDALPRLMKERAMGFLIKSEIENLGKIIEEPKSPYMFVFGGAKVSDKIPVIERLVDRVDSILIGGAMAYTFLKAKGTPVGKSLVEDSKVVFAGQLMERMEARRKKLLLPIDHRIVQTLDGEPEPMVTDDEKIPEGWMGVDIGPKTEDLFQHELSNAETVFWNGPMGVFEKKPYSLGTFAVAETLAALHGDVIVGGGDTAAAANASGYANKMTHISTGGGASLEYLQGKPLPGLEALRKTKRELASVT